MDYSLDTKAAIKADNKNAFIFQTGKYLGRFTRAEMVTSPKGTKGVDFSFVSDEEEKADYLTLWTHNNKGERLSGYDCLMAIMTCLRVKDIKPENCAIEKYDFEAKQMVRQTVPLYLDLMDKPIGLLLQMEEYIKGSGIPAWKPQIYAPFDKDEFTASEILGKAVKREKLEKMVLLLKDRPLKNQAQAAPQATPQSSGHGNADGFDDDIPF
ncbi:MAG: hypothetical protein FWH15_07730 [Betaproteobacteria bacterium]|nr:hypothetical protein [Betaproteobacteria bacterium]